MRITGGEFRGLTIKSPGREVRPTQDRVREALFSSILARIPGCRFLDLFAGSGAVGLGALSRGAEFVCWVESAPKVVGVLRHNVELVAGRNRGRVRVVRDNVMRFLERRDPALEGYDIIFADPPYDRGGKRRWSRKTLQALATGPMLAAQGLFIVEQSKAEPPEEGAAHVQFLRERVYGETCLRFYGTG